MSRRPILLLAVCLWPLAPTECGAQKVQAGSLAQARLTPTISVVAPLVGAAEAPARIQDLRRLLADPSLPSRDRNRISLELRALEARFAQGAGPRVPMAAPALVDSPEGVAGTLERVALDPSAASRAFDNGRSAAPAIDLVAGGPSSYRVAAPNPSRHRIAAVVPAPATPPATREPEGQLSFVSKHVVRVTADKGTTHAVGVAELLRAPDAAARTALSLEIARESLAAAGASGPRERALANFLRDAADYAPAGAVGALLSVDSADEFRLLFRLGDGGRRILSAQFLPGTAKEGDPDPGLVVMRPIELSASGEPKQEHPGYWRRYTADDRRLEWSAVDSTASKGWGPWKHEDKLKTVLVTEASWSGGRWQPRKSRTMKTLTTSAGKSWLGRTEDKVMKAPVVGKVLTFSDDVAATLYSGLIGGAQVLAGAVGDRDLYSLEAGGSYAKNPVMKKLVGDQGFLDRLTPVARQELDGAVIDRRRRALDAELFPLPPALRRSVLALPIRAPEAVAVLQEEYGAGSYGKRLLDEGARSSGWRSWAWSAGGVATGTVEKVAEGVMNPILWAMLGAGEAAGALRGVAAAGAGTKAASVAVGAARATTTAAWWAPWVFSAADNAGRVVMLTSEARFDRLFLSKAAEAGADALYMFVIP